MEVGASGLQGFLKGRAEEHKTMFRNPDDAGVIGAVLTAYGRAGEKDISIKSMAEDPESWLWGYLACVCRDCPGLFLQEIRGKEV